MHTLQLQQAAKSKTAMLIRKPVADVFEAFINPDITTRFWFTKSSGRLAVGKPVQWQWEMYDISIRVTPKVIEPNQRIVIEWPGYGGRTTVEWRFLRQTEGTTFVSISESGFSGDEEGVLNAVVNSTQGFSFVLAALKALLEHDIRLTLVADRHPSGVAEP
jgi:uncharacterized protein YndB with AHSA1/START domain